MERLDDGALRLRSGRSVWQADEASAAPVESVRPRAACELQCDVVVIGAGISGAFLAERLTRAGRRVVLIDRRAPAKGSTAASTAMLLWELDASLLELEDRLGFDAAALIAHQCRTAVSDIGALVNKIGIDCDFRQRPSLYLAGDKLDAVDLREEQRLRTRMEIEGALLNEGELAAMGFRGEGALFYQGSAEADPVRLALGLIAAAEARDAIVLSSATANIYHTGLHGVTVETREGDIIRADTLLLANGYEMPDFVDLQRHSLVSSWAVATTPREGFAWPENAVVWEASDPYLYLRATAQGRIIAGGEDEESSDPDKLQQLTPQKVEALRKRVAERCPALGDLDLDYAWSGVFGETEDSLPLIGRVTGQGNCLAAFGYGGNGITFSAIASEMLEAELEGRTTPCASLFALDRDG